jgi:ParB/RepB/Spo0J family partition protein
MEIEIHQLDQRYAALRRQDGRRERALLASLSEIGQQAPVIVVRTEPSAREGGRWVLVDGYKRVRALSRLKRDTVLAVAWELTEPEALLLSQVMRNAEAASALEQGWLLRELRDRFGLSAVELGQRFDKSVSWVSRRLGLVEELPEIVQEQVRAGRIVPHAAMKHLLPLARANAAGCAALAPVIGDHQLSSRQVGVLCQAFCAGTDETRQLVLTAPLVVLRAQAEAATPKEKTPAERLVGDLGAIAGIARRARALVDHEPLRGNGAATFKRLRCALQAARAEVAGLFDSIPTEVTNAGPIDPHGDPRAA